MFALLTLLISTANASAWEDIPCKYLKEQCPAYVTPTSSTIKNKSAYWAKVSAVLLEQVLSTKHVDVTVLEQLNNTLLLKLQMLYSTSMLWAQQTNTIVWQRSVVKWNAPLIQKQFKGWTTNVCAIKDSLWVIMFNLASTAHVRQQVCWLKPTLIRFAAHKTQLSTPPRYLASATRPFIRQITILPQYSSVCKVNTVLPRSLLLETLLPTQVQQLTQPINVFAIMDLFSFITKPTRITPANATQATVSV